MFHSHGTHSVQISKSLIAWISSCFLVKHKYDIWVGFGGFIFPSCYLPWFNRFSQNPYCQICSFMCQFSTVFLNRLAPILAPDSIALIPFCVHLWIDRFWLTKCGLTKFLFHIPIDGQILFGNYDSFHFLNYKLQLAFSTSLCPTLSNLSACC